MQKHLANLQEGDGLSLVPVRGGGDAASVVHLGGVGEHGGSHARGREAGGLRAANAVVRGLHVVGDLRADAKLRKGN